MSDDAATFHVTPAACVRIKQLLLEKPEESFFRVTILGGGCSGFQYHFNVDHVQNDDDQLFDKEGATIIVDAISLDLIKNSHLDYVDELIGAAFVVKNPNATASCGCGSSFSVF